VHDDRRYRHPHDPVSLPVHASPVDYHRFNAHGADVLFKCWGARLAHESDGAGDVFCCSMSSKCCRRFSAWAWRD